MKLAAELQKRSTGRTRLHPRRAHHRPAFRGHPQAARRHQRPCRQRQYGDRHRAQPGRDQDVGLDRRHGSRRRRRAAAPSSPRAPRKTSPRYPESYTGKFLAEYRRSAASRQPAYARTTQAPQSQRLAATRPDFRQRRREARADPHAVEPRRELVGAPLQGAPPVATGIFEELQLDARLVVLIPAAHHPSVPPCGRARHCRCGRKPDRDVRRGTNRGRTSPSWWRPGPAAVPPRRHRRVRARGRPAARSRGCRARSTSTAPMSDNACRAAVNVVPNHHLMSAAVAGPNVRSHRRSQLGSALRRAASVRCSPSQSRGGAHRGRDVVQAPSLGPRTISPRAESTVNTRGASGTLPPQRFPGAGSYVPAISGSAARSSVLLAGPLIQVAQHRRAGLVAATVRRRSATPALRTSATSRRRSLVGDPVAGGRLDHRQVIGVHHPQVRRIARCLTTERFWYSSCSRSAAAKPGHRAHSDRYGVAGSVACKSDQAGGDAVDGDRVSERRNCRASPSVLRRSARHVNLAHGPTAGSVACVAHRLTDLRQPFGGRALPRLELLLDVAALGGLGIQFGLPRSDVS